MSTMTDFDAEVSAWLDDPEAVGIPDAPHAAARVYGAMDRAIAAADLHETCTPEPARTFNVLLRVYGHDGAAAVQGVPPGTNVSCVLRGLTEDPEVAAIQMVGAEVPEYAEPEVTEANGVAVTSDVTDLRATWGGPKHLPRHLRRFRFPWRRNAA